MPAPRHRPASSQAALRARLARHQWRVREFRRALLRWYARAGRSFPWRKASASKYALVVSELLLQRTRAEVVARFFPSFLAQFPGWQELGASRDEELQILLEPIGPWRRRAASLRALAREMTRRRGRFPAARADIETLPGVGQYIANAVMVFCNNGREPLLDSGMARVLERCFSPRKLVDIRYDPWLQALASAVVDHRRVREINWAILDLAAECCTTRDPLCGACPVAECCRFALQRRRARAG